MLPSINRSALIITAKQGFFNKLAEISGEEAMKEEKPESFDESTVYLIPVDLFDDEAVWEYLENNYMPILKCEIESWYNLPLEWAEKVTFKQFKSWFTISYQSMVHDTLDNELDYDD